MGRPLGQTGMGPREKQRAQELRGSHLSWRQIATRMQVSEFSVRRACGYVRPEYRKSYTALIAMAEKAEVSV